jgi:4'-phosphopantetheinyl transferase EntD
VASPQLTTTLDSVLASRNAVLFARLFDGPVVVEEMDPQSVPADLSPLHPGEAAMMARAVEKRRREFTAGRVLARTAMGRLGIAEQPLLNGDDRAPIWPTGVVGTITHTRGWCAVAIAKATDLRALGADVEQDTPLEERLWDSVLNPDEIDHLQGMRPDEARALGKLIFSAKECAYKAQYLLTRTFLGFSAMSVVVDADAARATAGTWTATFRQSAGETFQAGDQLRGSFRRTGGLVATALVIPFESG